MQLSLVIVSPSLHLPAGLELFCTCQPGSLMPSPIGCIQQTPPPRCFTEQEGELGRRPVTSGHCPASARPLSCLEALFWYLRRVRTRAMHTLELTLLLIFTPLPPTLQGQYYHSSHFTDEESEPEPQQFYVIKHRFSSWRKGNNQQQCLLRKAHSFSQGDRAPADLPGKCPAFGPRGTRKP